MIIISFHIDRIIIIEFHLILAAPMTMEKKIVDITILISIWLFMVVRGSISLTNRKTLTTRLHAFITLDYLPSNQGIIFIAIVIDFQASTAFYMHIVIWLGTFFNF